MVMILDGLLLVILSWNSRLAEPSSPIFLISLWVLLVIASIYLFFFASRQTVSDYHGDLQNRKTINYRKEEHITPAGHSAPVKERLDIEAKVRKILRGVSDDDRNEEKGNMLLQNLAGELEIMSGLVYFKGKNGIFKAEARYAVDVTHEPYTFREGEGLTGQTAKNGQVHIMTNIPDDYPEVSSGLGNSKPKYLAMIPVLKNNHTCMVIEISGFKYDISDLERIFHLMSRLLSEKSDSK